MVTWDPIPPIEQNGVITTYEVLYTPQESFEGQIGPQTRAVVAPNTTVVLTDLQEYVFYDVSVRASTSAGSSEYSEPTLARTLEDGKYLRDFRTFVSCVTPSLSWRVCTIQYHSEFRGGGGGWQIGHC